jgi:hypothetical protein
MIRIYHRSADSKDIEAMTQGKGSLVWNIVTVTLPIGAILFGGLYPVAHSYVLALVVAGVFVLGSVWSNTKFFRTVGRRKISGPDARRFPARFGSRDGLAECQAPHGGHGRWTAALR